MENNTNRGAREPKQAKPLSLREVYDFVLHNWYWFLLSVVFFPALGYVVCKVLPPKWDASATIFVDDEYSRSVSLDVMGLHGPGPVSLMGGGNEVDDEISILKSRTLMRRVVGDLNANIRYYRKTGLRETEVYSKYTPVVLVVDSLRHSFSIKMNLAPGGSGKFSARIEYKPLNGRKIKRDVEGAYGEMFIDPAIGSFTLWPTEYFDPFRDQWGDYFRVGVSDPMKEARNYAEDINIAAASLRSNIVNISLRDRVPEKSADIVNDLIRVYNEDAIDGKRRTAEATIEFIDERLDAVAEELSDVDALIAKFKSDNVSIDVRSEAGIYLTSIGEYQNELVATSLQMSLLENVEDYLDRSDMGLLPVDIGIDDESLTEGIVRYNEMILARMGLSGEYSGGNPVLRDLDMQITSMRGSLRESLNNIHKSLGIKKRALENQIDELVGRVGNMPEYEMETLSIGRDQATKSALYAFLMNKREETALKMASGAQIARVVDMALPAEKPAVPKKILVMLIFLIVGLLLPVGVVFLMEQLRDKVGSVGEVEDNVSVPIVGVIPSRGSSADERIVTRSGMNPVSEAFRVLSADLEFMMPKGGKVIMVTSSMPGEGKGFTSINLARSLAITGKKVVLADLDLRKASLSGRLGGKPQSKGLVNYLAGKEDDLDKLMIKGVVNGVDVLYAGAVPPNPAELVAGDRMAKALAKLREEYDYIVADTPPVGVVADALLINKFADVTLFTVRIGRSFRRNLPSINSIGERKVLKNLSVVVTDAGASRGYFRQDKFPAYGYGGEQEKRGDRIISSLKKRLGR